MENKKILDVAIGSNGAAKLWYYGFFEKTFAIVYGHSAPFDSENYVLYKSDKGVFYRLYKGDLAQPGIITFLRHNKAVPADG